MPIPKGGKGVTNPKDISEWKVANKYTGPDPQGEGWQGLMKRHAHCENGENGYCLCPEDGICKYAISASVWFKIMLRHHPELTRPVDDVQTILPVNIIKEDREEEERKPFHWPTRKPRSRTITVTPEKKERKPRTPKTLKTEEVEESPISRQIRELLAGINNQ